ncbi:hypothetical protein [Rufibacter roseolus]|uniref:hypothetical protein n=1 Tax=Rufibacter roseolus TaxID=2817375 RepID=UPI001B3185B2|nr:hypothetical protein [Rufibacter roseolus]
MMQLFIRYLLVLIATLPVVGGQACAASMGEAVVESPSQHVEACLRAAASEELLFVFKQAVLNESFSEEETVTHAPGFDSPVGEPASAFFSGLSFTQWPSASDREYGSAVATAAHLPLYMRYHSYRL